MSMTGSRHPADQGERRKTFACNTFPLWVFAQSQTYLSLEESPGVPTQP